jgi:intracellular multiplication protein IcmL
MKLKALNVAMLLAVSSGFPLTTLADTTESPTTNVASQATDLSQPNKPDSTLLSWASSTAVATFTYDSKNYRNEIQKLSGFFTDDGWSQFMSELDKSKNLDAVKNKQLTVSAVVSAPPVIIKKGALNNVYSWQVQLPMTITYQGDSEFTKQNVIVTMLISRTSSVNSPDGIAINQYLIGPFKGYK